MSDKSLIFESDSLEEARKKASNSIPKDAMVVSEEIIEAGNAEEIIETSNTFEKAFKKAKSKIPKGAKKLGESVLDEGKNETISFEGYDESEIKELAKKKIKKSKILEINLVEKGKTGFLGFGRKPDKYNVL